MKRYFMIYTGRYGGEVVVGKSTEDFVNYWKDKDQDELIEHVFNIDWDEEGGDPDSPLLTEHGNSSWHEVDDYEHINGPYHDNQYWVSEIKLADGVTYEDGALVYPADWNYGTLPYEEISEGESYGYGNYVYGREAYTSEKEDEGTYIPVLQFHSAEKGSFGTVIIETDGEDFDPEKLAIGTVETDLCEIIEAYWYNSIPLDIDFEYADTVGKGSYACVGYINEKWYDDPKNFTHDSVMVQESLKDIYAQYTEIE